MSFEPTVEEMFGSGLDSSDAAVLHEVMLAAPQDENLVELAAKGRLDWSPGKNWVEEAGGLPKYIEDIALALIRDHGMDRSKAISIAISRVKKWASGGGNVDADTRAKAQAAVAQWEKLKAKNKAKSSSKN